MENTKEEFYSMSLVTTVFMFLVFSPFIIILVAGTINLIAVKNYWGFATLAVAIFLATLMVKEIIGRSRLLISDDGIEIKSSLEVKKFSWNKVISAETKRYHLGYQFLVIALGSWNSPYVLLSVSKSPVDKPESFILFHASARTCDTVSATINDRVKENKRKLNAI